LPAVLAAVTKAAVHLVAVVAVVLEDFVQAQLSQLHQANLIVSQLVLVVLDLILDLQD
jgi:hypothetical protein